MAEHPTSTDPLELLAATEHRRLPVLLRRAWYGLNQAFRRRIIHTGLTPDQFTALRNLQEAGRTGLIQSELTERMSSDPNTIASLVDRMKKAGMIDRAPDEGDRRAYRLRLNGDEAAGTFMSPVTYRIRDPTQTATHTARVNLPTFLALRWLSAPASGSATLRFEYAAAPMAYLQAVTAGAPLAPTSADFDRLEVSTNHPSGYTVTVLVTPLDAPSGAPSLVPRLMLAGATAEGRRFTSTGPTDGFVTLATPDDFGLVVDGSETPGAYRIELRYEAARNP